MEFWQHIYSNFNVIAFSIFGLKVHWYGIMYVIALLLALLLAKFFVRKFQLDINEKHLDSYFIWVEIGVILKSNQGVTTPCLFILTLGS